MFASLRKNAPLLCFLALSCTGVRVRDRFVEAVTPPRVLAPEELPDWLPPWEVADELEWLRLGTGEWLRGELIALAQDEVEFDSEELDVVNFDWKNVDAIYTTRPFNVLLDDQSVYLGALRVRGKRFVVLDDAGAGTDLDREDALRITTGEPHEFDHWSGKVGLGWTTRSGNTEETDVNVSIETVRRDTTTRLALAYDYLLSSADDSEVTNNHRFSGQYDIFAYRRLYFTPFGLTAVKDRFQNIDYRLTPYAGVGYVILDKDADLEALLGVGYRLTKFDSVEVGGDDTDDDFAAVFTARFEMDVTAKTEIDAEYSMTVPVSDTNATDQHGVITLSFDIYKNLDLDLKFRWDRVGAPEEDSSGQTPDNDDFRWEIAFSWEF